MSHICAQCPCSQRPARSQWTAASCGPCARRRAPSYRWSEAQQAGRGWGQVARTAAQPMGAVISYATHDVRGHAHAQQTGMAFTCCIVSFDFHAYTATCRTPVSSMRHSTLGATASVWCMGPRRGPGIPREKILLDCNLNKQTLYFYRMTMSGSASEAGTEPERARFRTRRAGAGRRAAARTYPISEFRCKVL